MEEQELINRVVQDIDVESENMLIQQTKWVLERHENLNQGLMTRAVSLVGFAGIELSLVGQMIINLRKTAGSKKWSFDSQLVMFGIEALAVLALITCIGFLFWSVRPRKDVYIPGVGDIISRLEDSKDPSLSERAQSFLRLSLPMDQMMMKGPKGLSYSDYLTQENRHRGQYFVYGFNTLVFSQFALGILVLVAYWR